MLELVELCARLVEKAVGLRPTLEPEALPLVDHTLKTLARSSDAERILAVTAAGAWFGELVRGNFPARWLAPRDDQARWRIEFEPVFLHFSPVAFAHEAALESEVVQGGAGFGVLEEEMDLLRAGLEALGSLPEEDFYLLSTRYEVLQTVYDRLLAARAAEPEHRVHYDADAYRALLDDELRPVGDA